MNENAKKWVEALRSGEFKQTDSRLHRDGSYCCLGVACELYRRDTGKGRWTKGGAFHLGRYVEDEWLPNSVQRWLGLDSKDGTFVDEDLYTDCLGDRNDAGVPFDQIADIIAEQPGGLFRV